MYKVSTLFGEEVAVRLCYVCGEHKPIVDFPTRYSPEKAGKALDDPTVERRNQCKSCRNNTTRQKNNAVKGLIKPKKTSPNYVCTLCKKDVHQMTKKGLVADHCHITGLFRGWICDKCNTGMERFGDDPATLRKAAEYQENFIQRTKEMGIDYERKVRESHRTSKRKTS
jgi:hypothetical protein